MFGKGHPFMVDDLPPGRMREKLESLPEPAHPASCFSTSTGMLCPARHGTAAEASTPAPTIQTVTRLPSARPS
jgi:hypothetical protein